MDKVNDYTYTKGTVEKYDIRWNRGEWAVFTIDNASGLMQCHSSYGDWGYSWPHHGRESFKHFIIEMERDWHYLLKKTSKPVFDFDESIKYWKNHIIELRRDDSCTKEEARAAFDEIMSLDNNGPMDNSACAYILNDSTAISDADPDFWELLGGKRLFSQQDMTFAKTIWPMLCDIIRKELAGDDNENG